VRGIIWETISFIITLTAVYAVYGDLNFAIKFNIILTLVKVVFFFAHERVWKEIRWGNTEQ
jgi:uncharacterized membrane protein